MQIKFCGADREVTGSCHLVKTSNNRFLVDCGMFQGSNFNEGRNHDDFPFDPKDIDFVLVTHAHLDHIGRIPKLIKEGFTGAIYMTEATCEFAKLIWEDAYGIMKYNHRKYNTPILFDENDVAEAISHCKGVKYNKKIKIEDNIFAVWKDAGHIFGAAFIEVEVSGKKIGFSGDIGNENVPILRDTQNLDELDVLLVESTYGDRLHEDIDTRRSIIHGLLKRGIQKGGTIMIPAFSLERTQELLYELNLLIEHDNLLPNVPIYLDSPLAIDATKVYKKFPSYYDQKAMCLHKAGDDFFEFPNLKMTYTKEESKKINRKKGPKVVIAGSGMMNGGRILHHAIRYLSDSNSTLIIVGYQANGTLGRRLYEGAEKVKIFGQDVGVKCEIKAIGALSAHGDQTKLVNWVNSGTKAPKKVYCVHGEPNGVTELAHKIKEALGVESYVPEYEEEVEV
ncbi:MAG: MBL fold metallo-hydrolase [Candidatus Magasanikbacteria bacterium]|nr:MBL fold metallo-hydrolase [Candidatus Magasanikbacteria bacterium]